MQFTYSVICISFKNAGSFLLFCFVNIHLFLPHKKILCGYVYRIIALLEMEEEAVFLDFVYRHVTCHRRKEKLGSFIATLQFHLKKMEMADFYAFQIGTY